MLAASASKLCRLPVKGLVTSTLSKQQILQKPINTTCLTIRVQSTESGKSTLRRLKNLTLKERAMAPAGDGAFTIGKGFVAGAAVLGVGALAFYGLGLATERGAIDKVAFWGADVKSRIRTTYMYFAGGLLFTAGSAIAAASSPMMMRLVTANSLMAICGSMALMIGTGMVCRSIPYKPGFGAKQLAWMAHAATVGIVLAPITLIGGPLLVRAAAYTAGIIGGLSTVAICAPSEKFLYIGGPLAMGLGVVMVSSIGSAFLPPTSALGAGLYSISMYGGLVLFSAFLLYNTQKIIHDAETKPNFDPVNSSIGIYLDTVNIFMRLAILLASGGNMNRRR